MEKFPGTKWFQQLVWRFGFLALVGFFVVPVLALDRFVDHADGTVTDIGRLPCCDVELVTGHRYDDEKKGFQ